jgi:hypothetical protein
MCIPSLFIYLFYAGIFMSLRVTLPVTTKYKSININAEAVDISVRISSPLYFKQGLQQNQISSSFMKWQVGP